MKNSMISKPQETAYSTSTTPFFEYQMFNEENKDKIE